MHAMQYLNSARWISAIVKPCTRVHDRSHCRLVLIGGLLTFQSKQKLGLHWVHFPFPIKLAAPGGQYTLRHGRDWGAFTSSSNKQLPPDDFTRANDSPCWGAGAVILCGLLIQGAEGILKPRAPYRKSGLSCFTVHFASTSLEHVMGRRKDVKIGS